MRRELTRKLLGQVIASREYQGLPDDTKRDMIGDVFRKVRDLARGLTIQQSPDFAQRLKETKK